MGLAAAGFAVSAIGTGLGALGQMRAGEAAQANADYQAQVARNNQIIAEQNAQYASQAGNAAVTRQQMKDRATLGSITAGLAAEGVDVNSGSPARVRSSAAELGQLDTETEAQNAALRVYGFRTQGMNYGAQAGLYKAQGEQAAEAGKLAAFSTLLSGGSSLASKWSGWQSPSSGFGDWSAMSGAVL